VLFAQTPCSGVSLKSAHVPVQFGGVWRLPTASTCQETRAVGTFSKTAVISVSGFRAEFVSYFKGRVWSRAPEFGKVQFSCPGSVDWH